MTSGSTAYSRSKGQQDNSMPSKQEPSEDVYDVVLQDPRDKARAVLLESQTPARQAHLPRRQRLERGHQHPAESLSPSVPSGWWAMDDQSIQGTEQVKGSNGTPTLRSDICRFGNAGWPTGRESYGHGAPVVVGGRKGSDPPSTTGKPATGRRGSRRKLARARGATPTGRAGASGTQPTRYVRCVQPSRSWGSFVNSEMRHWRAGCDRKTHAQFGKGPKEKGQKWHLAGGLLHCLPSSEGAGRRRAAVMS